MRFARVSVAAAAGLALVAGLARRVRRRRVAETVIRDPQDASVVDGLTGAVRSVQAADVLLPADELERIWNPMHLERLARTYWRFLTRCTLGLIRVHYTERERFVVLIGRPLVLLSFQAPEYEMDRDRGLVRWRIESGVLVSRRGRGGDGYLQIEVQRSPGQAGQARVHVEVEVANFYPSIASSISQRFYQATQSRIHVIVTHGFLRSLARLDLAPSRVGRYARAAGVEAVPGPAGTGQATAESPDATRPRPAPTSSAGG